MLNLITTVIKSWTYYCYRLSMVDNYCHIL